jgi:molybdenum cofactor biosynthesis enzyme MoaA
MRIHRWLDFKVTRRCNNFSRRCGYCDVSIDPVTAPELLSLSDIHQCLLDARSLGFDIFWFLGGEPSLRADAAEIVDPLAEDPNVILTIVTNGQKRAEQMYLSLFSTAARRACVQVSLDTLATDNLKRADPGHLSALITDLHEIAKDFSTASHTCAVEVHCVITRENLSCFDDFVRFFAAKGIAVSLAMVCPWTLTDDPVRFNEFTKEELLSICTRIHKLQTGLSIDHFNPLVAAHVQNLLMDSTGETGRPCGAGLTHLVINGDGAVHRCMAESFNPISSLGNIRVHRLHHILRSVDKPSICRRSSDCFDAFAWDSIALSELESPT